MKYDWKFKYQCVLDYKAGKTIPLDNFKNAESRRSYVRLWVRLFDIHGVDGLKHKSSNKEWTQLEKYQLVAKTLAGQSLKTVAVEAGINPGQFHHWVSVYKQYGYDGLQLRKRGRLPKGTIMTSKKKKEDMKLLSSEKEELILLRERLQYLEAENAYLKNWQPWLRKRKRNHQPRRKSIDC